MNTKKLVQKLIVKNRSDDLVRTFSKFNCSIKVIGRERYGPWDIYKLTLKGSTRETHIRARAPDVQTRLQVERLIVEKFDQRLFIFIADEELEYDHLPVVLMKESCLNRLRQMSFPIQSVLVSAVNRL